MRHTYGRTCAARIWTLFRCQLKSAPMVLVADTLPDGHSAPFRRMIAHPPIVQRLNMTLTPADYDMEDNDVIDYFVEATGGGHV